MSKQKMTTITINAERGRDPFKGMLSFKTGVIKTKRTRGKVRGDKYHSRELRRQTQW